MEFFVVFAVSLIVLTGVALALSFGKPPTYRPDRKKIYRLLSGVLEKSTSMEEWELFLSLPISHDPELESLRQDCVVIAYGDYDIEPAKAGINGAIFDKRGLARVSEVLNRLEKLLQEEPLSRWF